MADSSRGGSVVLIGMRGSGKTTVGRMLADLAGLALVDTDERIEATAGMSIAEVFDAEGEAGFRRRECEVIAALSGQPPAVVSAGGGAVLRQTNREALLALGPVVWLTAPPDVLWTRIQRDHRTQDTRPALTDFSGPEEMERLLLQRTPLYSGMADLALDTTDEAPGILARRIFDWMSSTSERT